jgi:hypothetical protein
MFPMHSRKEESKKAVESRKEQGKRRVQIEKLEERIAPGHIGHGPCNGHGRSPRCRLG